MLAAADAVTCDRTLTLSPGAGIRIAIAGDELAERLAPAFAPLQADAPATIEITAWEGTPSRRLRLRGGHILGGRRRRGPPLARRGAAARGRPRRVLGRDAEASRWKTAAPLRTLLRWALRRHGLHMVHAAAVVGPRGAALLAGPSGAGKSTTALAASAAGLGYIADDYCAVELGTPPVAHALCAVGKLETPWPGLEILPGGATPDGKQIVVPPRLTRSAPIVSLVLPRVTARGPAFEPARPAEALSALASSLLLLPGSRRTTCKRSARSRARSLPTGSPPAPTPTRPPRCSGSTSRERQRRDGRAQRRAAPRRGDRERPRADRRAARDPARRRRLARRHPRDRDGARRARDHAARRHARRRVQHRHRGSARRRRRVLSDDTWLPRKLELQLERLRTADACVCHAEFFLDGEPPPGFRPNCSTGRGRPA